MTQSVADVCVCVGELRGGRVVLAVGPSSLPREGEGNAGRWQGLGGGGGDSAQSCASIHVRACRRECSC